MFSAFFPNRETRKPAENNGFCRPTRTGGPTPDPDPYQAIRATKGFHAIYPYHRSRGCIRILRCGCRGDDAKGAHDDLGIARCALRFNAQRSNMWCSTTEPLMLASYREEVRASNFDDIEVEAVSEEDGCRLLAYIYERRFSSALRLRTPFVRR